jgi:tRNA threonylcarbamoyladenosine biosynthesis protein TsaE
MNIDYSLQDINQAAQKLLEVGQKHRIWLFEGEMGAGKTTLIKALGQALGVLGTVQSPTFSLVNQYLTAQGETIYHFDCYRLRHPHEALDIGLEEYLDSGEYCWIEWPSQIAELLPADAWVVAIEKRSDTERRLRTYPWPGTDC